MAGQAAADASARPPRPGGRAEPRRAVLTSQN
jgi:hypothetical protein